MMRRSVSRRSFLLLAASVSQTHSHDLLQPSSEVRQTNRLQAAIDEAAASNGRVALAAGTFLVDTLDVTRAVEITGVPGLTILKAKMGPVLDIRADHVTLRGLTLECKDKQQAVVTALGCENLIIGECTFSGGKDGLNLERCSGHIRDCQFSGQAGTGLFSLDAKGLMISGNAVQDIGNNGIQVWQSEKHEDGTQIIGNHIHDIRADDGGDGPYGNGIAVFRAGNVIVANNRISDVRFSGIRNNTGSNISITGNSISRTGEVALYVEFAYQGAVIANNVIEDVVFGISITNFNDDGRLTVCNGNLIRNAHGDGTDVPRTGGGIHCEADTVVSNNVIEDVKGFAIQMGWGGRNRNLSALGNTIRHATVGIAPSVVEGSGAMMIANNVIEGAGIAIQGFDYLEAKTGDLSATGAQVPPHITISNTIVRS
jgi:uncharacterized secreted repeat protein (TIGR03808 family)